MEKQRNPVAKNAKKFNKASVQRDRKKDQKRGYKVKHKDKLYASTTPPVGEDITSSDMNGLQKDAGKLKKHGIDLDLGTRHFKDRANDDRNEPTITKQDIQSLIKKIDNGKGVKIKQRGDGEAVLRDKKTKINVPVAVRKDRDGSGKKISTATAKTIMRKKDFKSSSPTIAYEDSGKVSGIDGSKRVGTKIVPKYIPKKDAVITISADNSDVSELSNRTLSSYKTKAAKSASAADKAGNYKKADKRFSGITRATNKQFKNDAKKESSVDRDKTKSYIPPGVSAVKEELDNMKKRKHMNLKRRVKNGDRSAVTQLRQFEKDHAKDLEKKPRSAKQITKGDGSAQDSNLIVQLRKSQDSGGKHAIEVGGGKKVKLDKKTVDNLLKQYDKMKPDSKRKWQTVATKKLRSMAK